MSHYVVSFLENLKNKFDKKKFSFFRNFKENKFWETFEKLCTNLLSNNINNEELIGSEDLIREIRKNDTLLNSLNNLSFKKRHFSIIGNKQLFDIFFQLFRDNKNFISGLVFYYIEDENLVQLNKMREGGIKIEEDQTRYAFQKGKFHLALNLIEQKYNHDSIYICPNLESKQSNISESIVIDVMKEHYKTMPNYDNEIIHQRNEFYRQLNIISSIIIDSVTELNIPLIDVQDFEYNLRNERLCSYNLNYNSRAYARQFKQNFEYLCCALLSPEISKYIKKQYIVDLYEQRNACHPGYFATIQRIKDAITSDNNNLKNLINAKRGLVIDNYIPNHLMKKEVSEVWMPHVRYDFMKYIQTKGYSFKGDELLNVNDDYSGLDLLKITNTDLIDFYEYFTKEDSLESHIENISNALISNISNDPLTSFDVTDNNITYEKSNIINNALLQLDIFAGVENLNFFTCINVENLDEELPKFKFELAKFHLAIIYKLKEQKIIIGDLLINYEQFEFIESLVIKSKKQEILYNKFYESNSITEDDLYSFLEQQIDSSLKNISYYLNKYLKKENKNYHQILILLLKKCDDFPGILKDKLKFSDNDILYLIFELEKKDYEASLILANYYFKECNYYLFLEEIINKKTYTEKLYDEEGYSIHYLFEALKDIICNVYLYIINKIYNVFFGTDFSSKVSEYETPFFDLHNNCSLKVSDETKHITLLTQALEKPVENEGIICNLMTAEFSKDKLFYQSFNVLNQNEAYLLFSFFVNNENIFINLFNKVQSANANEPEISKDNLMIYMKDVVFIKNNNFVDYDSDYSNEVADYSCRF